MALPTLFPRIASYRPGPAAQLVIALALALACALAVIGPARLIAQIEGDRGILPVATSSDIQVGGVEVEATGKDAQEARENGWKMAQKLAWQKLGGPEMADGAIEAMVTAVVIESEQIGPRRYIARLGVVFDRTKAGQYLTSTEGGATAAHSAPMLLIPVLYSGGTAQVFEVKGLWQRTWAEFNAGASAIDYVRPSGANADSLIITAGQPGRRSRLWWRTVLDQFAASDVIMPIARLERQWPGGPVKGTFTARYGPDNMFLDSFTMEAPDENGVRAMLDQALMRFDRIFTDALNRGLLKPDPTLNADTSAIDAAIAAVSAAVVPAESQIKDNGSTETAGPATTASQSAAPAQVATYTVQFASPDAQAVDSALGSVRGAPGVQGAGTSSIAIGGTSVMRVTFAGDLDALAAALRARGWQVSVGNGALSIRR